MLSSFPTFHCRWIYAERPRQLTVRHSLSSAVTSQALADSCWRGPRVIFQELQDSRQLSETRPTAAILPGGNATLIGLQLPR